MKGQLEGLEKMLEGEEYCMDIMVQSLAIQKALASLNKLVLENHLRTHVQEAFTKNDDTILEDTTQELLDLYELTAIRAKR